jgi:hypothetical protein
MQASVTELQWDPSVSIGGHQEASKLTMNENDS